MVLWQTTHQVRVTNAPVVHFSVKNFYFAKYLLSSLIYFHVYTCHRGWAAATPVKYERDMQQGTGLLSVLKEINGRNWFSKHQP